MSYHHFLRAGGFSLVQSIKLARRISGLCPYEIISLFFKKGLVIKRSHTAHFDVYVLRNKNNLVLYKGEDSLYIKDIRFGRRRIVFVDGSSKDYAFEFINA